LKKKFRFRSKPVVRYVICQQTKGGDPLFSDTRTISKVFSGMEAVWVSLATAR